MVRPLIHVVEKKPSIIVCASDCVFVVTYSGLYSKGNVQGSAVEVTDIGSDSGDAHHAKQKHLKPWCETMK